MGRIFRRNKASDVEVTTHHEIQDNIIVRYIGHDIDTISDEIVISSDGQNVEITHNFDGVLYTLTRDEMGSWIASTYESGEITNSFQLGGGSGEESEELRARALALLELTNLLVNGGLREPDPSNEWTKHCLRDISRQGEIATKSGFLKITTQSGSIIIKCPTLDITIQMAPTDAQGEIDKGYYFMIGRMWSDYLAG